MLRSTPAAALGNSNVSTLPPAPNELTDLQFIAADGWLLTTVIAAEMRGRFALPPHSAHWVSHQGITQTYQVEARDTDIPPWTFGPLAYQTIDNEVRDMSTLAMRAANPGTPAAGIGYDARRIAIEAPYPEVLMGLLIKKVRNAATAVPYASANFDGVNATLLVLDAIRYVVSEPSLKLKQLLRIPRPYDTRQPGEDPEWNTMVADELTSADVRPYPLHRSYPAGHPTVAYCAARVLGKLLGDHGTADQALNALAERITWDRYLAGLHTPTDLRAGKSFGEFIGDVMIECARDTEHCPSWSAVFAQARRELI